MTWVDDGKYEVSCRTVYLRLCSCQTVELRGFEPLHNVGDLRFYPRFTKHQQCPTRGNRTGCDDPSSHVIGESDAFLGDVCAGAVGHFDPVDFVAEVGVAEADVGGDSLSDVACELLVGVGVDLYGDA